MLEVTDIKTIGIVGAGQMGAGIAQVLATAGYSVIIMDINTDSLEKGMKTIEKGLHKFELKGKLEEDIPTITKRVKTTTTLTSFSECQFAIEAVHENEELKKQIFKNLDEILPAEAIIATNTSSISITRLASYTDRADQFIGMHFMNPVPLMTLVELIKGHCTSEETYLLTKQLSEKIKKATICSEDYPAFIVNRILIFMLNEAFYTLMEGVATADDIDKAMKLGTNQPMGPLALADFIGLDTCYSIMKVLHEGLGDDKYRPCPLLRKYVEAGKLGRKTGEGIYKYN